MAALSAASSFTHMSLEALLSHDHELYLDRILEEVVGANCMPDSCPLMQSRECDLALNVLQIVVSGQSQPQKEALFFCTRSSWSLLRALVQMLSFEGFIVFGVCHTRLEPNGFASVTLMHSPSHAINNVGCLCHTNGSIWFLLPFKHISPFQRLVARKFNFNVTEMMCNYFKVQDSALIPDSKLIFQGNLYASMLFGSDTVPELLRVSEHMCQLSESVDPKVINIEDDRDRSHCNPLDTNCTLEVTDFDLSIVKREIESDDDESIGRTNLDSKENCSSIEQLCEQYYNVVKRRRFQHRGYEPMLIVQCPGCIAEFRGLSDRICRLVQHIQTHHPECRAHYIKMIAKRYRQLFDIMKRRMNLSK